MTDRLPAPGSISFGDAVARLHRAGPPRRWPAYDGIDEPKRAAILVPIVALPDGRAATIVTRRHAKLRSHGDDWVFPGGAVDDADVDGADAARREAAEELGLRVDQISVIARLDTHGPIVTGYLVDVYAGTIDPGADLAPQADEVAEHLVVALDELRRPGRSWWAPMPHVDNIDAEHVAKVMRSGNELRWYDLGADDQLWGMQGNIAFNLLQLIDPAHQTGGRAGSEPLPYLRWLLKK